MTNSYTDGNRILDYLGAVVVESLAPEDKEHMVQPAYEFELAEQKRLIAEGNAELIKRYALFRSYFESRLSLWSVPESKS